MDKKTSLIPANVGFALEAVHLGRLVDVATHSFTAYSNVFNLREGVIYLYYLAQFDQVVELRLEEELANGQRIIKMSDLFPHNVTEVAVAEFKAIHTQGRILLLVAAASLIIAIGLLVSLVYKVMKKLRRFNTQS